MITLKERCTCQGATLNNKSNEREQTLKLVGSLESQLRVQPTTWLNRAARARANALTAVLAVSLRGLLIESTTITSAFQPGNEHTESHITSSSTNGKLKNPTSCPTPVFASNGISPLLAARPSATQSAVPSPLASDALHSFFLVFSAYPVAGKKPEVHVSGEKYCQVPVVVVYCGYLMGFGRALNVARTFCGTREEKSSELTDGFVADVVARRE
jgi:hypothetical protein